ncbi:unnamed protein product [Periconia digitata]|uniref:Uncharacterized protein n=1 Tax=Periconia digitata TaxID=1303443 RepID=A0A9W4U2C8_9PLEO|nr:unnamed protein product [Periconia digitata]
MNPAKGMEEVSKSTRLFEPSTPFPNPRKDNMMLLFDERPDMSDINPFPTKPSPPTSSSLPAKTTRAAELVAQGICNMFMSQLRQTSSEAHQMTTDHFTSKGHDEPSVNEYDVQFEENLAQILQPDELSSLGIRKPMLINIRSLIGKS